MMKNIKINLNYLISSQVLNFQFSNLPSMILINNNQSKSIKDSSQYNI